MTTRICVVVVGLVIALICFEASDETTTAIAPQSRISIRNIINFQLRVMMLLEDAESVEDFEEYFDAPLHLEMQYILNRLRGFASDVAQADEWQHAARHFFRFYLVNICVAQAREYAEAYSSQLESSNDASRLCSLKESSVCPAAERMTEMFNANFHAPQLADPTLLYEVIRFTRLPVVVVLNPTAAPILRVLLRDGTCARYVEMPNGGVPANFSPAEYAPRENILNDMRLLSYALSSMLNSRESFNAYDFSYANRRLAGRNGLLYRFLRPSLRNLMKHNSRVAQGNGLSECIIEIVVRELLVNFLHNEYGWLMCHPVYRREENRAQVFVLARRIRALHNALINRVQRVHSTLLRAHLNLVTSLGARLEARMLSGGYSLRRVYDLASARALASSTSPLLARAPPTMSSSTKASHSKKE